MKVSTKSKKYVYSTGTSLLISKDSTFELTTCGNIIIGKWYCASDSLFLKCDRNKYRIDSLNNVWTPPRCGTLVYFRTNEDELYTVVDSNINGYIAIDLLRKIR